MAEPDELPQPQPQPQGSPISLLLSSLGMTRDDLTKRSEQMRLFLKADSPVDAASTAGRALDPLSPTEHVRSRSKSSASLASLASLSSSARFGGSRPGSVFSQDASEVPEPSTPAVSVKSEPNEVALPGRAMDTMEAVIERQRLAREEKTRKRKEREGEGTTSHRYNSSASLSSTDLHSNFRSTSHEEDGRATSSMTPQQTKYYREHTAEQSPFKQEESPVLQTNGKHSSSSSHSYFSQATCSEEPPFTPQKKHHNSDQSSSSPLPPSSPPTDSSPPSSSPIRVVSSLSSTPLNDAGPRSLPYTLPPGPYSPIKPHYSYAALIGQAILSSAGHRLTLQEIYDWITTVYPYFKRGETTWMNSIRHVLSTTVVFRKVVRERALGRTQWAIFDEDLECFKGGGFKKQLCKDAGGAPTSSAAITKDKDDGKEAAASSSSTKAKRARNKDDGAGAEGSEGTRRVKRSRKDKQATSDPSVKSGDEDKSLTLQAAPQPFHLSGTKPTTQHQPYYENVAIAPGVLSQPFRLIANAGWTGEPGACGGDGDVRGSSIDPEGGDIGNEQESDADYSSSPFKPKGARPPPPSSSTSSSFRSSVPDLPELTPNRSSSSPPPSSDMDLDLNRFSVSGPGLESAKEIYSQSGAPIHVTVSSGDSDEEDQLRVPSEERTKLTPVQFWEKSSPGGGKMSVVSHEDLIFQGSAAHSRKRARGRYLSINGDTMSASDPESEPREEIDELEETSVSEDSGDDEKDSYRPKASKKAKKAKKANDSMIPFNLPPSPTPHRRSTRLVIKASLSESDLGPSFDDVSANALSNSPPSASTSNTHPIASHTASSTSVKKARTNKNIKAMRLPSPSPFSNATPSTPPRLRKALHLSPVHTPLSHRGFHMSPAASLAHYKSNLDPPPPATLPQADDERDAGPSNIVPQEDSDKTREQPDLFRTPSRKRGKGPFASDSTVSSDGMFTPRKLLFPHPSNIGVNESPLFRTPGTGLSPFRMGYGAGGMIDPHDPMLLLTDELNGAAQPSPLGLFGKKVLYESPGGLERDRDGNLNTPGRWNKWW